MEPFRVIATGVRHFRDYALLRAGLDHLLQHRRPGVVIHARCGRGTDALATTATARTRRRESAATRTWLATRTPRLSYGIRLTATSATSWGAVGARAFPF